MSSIFPFRTRGEIEAEARAWIVQLDGRTPTKEDLAALSEWARRSPRHAAALVELSRLWSDIDGLAVFAESAPEEQAAARPRRRWAIAAVAAAAVMTLALAGAAAMFARRLEPAQPQTTFATAVGEQRAVRLPDGTQLEINTNSLVEIAYTRGERRIRLVRGEALFDVATDASRPFVVLADDSAVRAVGTRFAVRFERRQIDVAVSEGVVELIADRVDQTMTAMTYRLAAYQTASMAAGDRTASIGEIEPRALDRQLAWSRGVLAFEGEPLSEVVAEVSRYTETSIVVADPELLEMRVGGRFGIGETEALLEALESGFGVEVSREGDSVVVLSKASE